MLSAHARAKAQAVSSPQLESPDQPSEYVTRMYTGQLLAEEGLLHYNQRRYAQAVESYDAALEELPIPPA